MVENRGREMSGRTQIQVRRLRVSYDKQEILHGVEFDVNQGEFVAIVGKSGCGKSTLLNAIAGFIDREGEVQIPALFGVVFQNYAVFPWLTVRGNIGFGLSRLNHHERDTVVSGLLELTGLSKDASKYPGQLSGGQAQRVALARAVAPDPEVLLMDEPFGALDMYTREKMQNWLRDIWEGRRVTVLFVTHNIEEAVFLADRVIVFGPGTILAEVKVNFSRPRSDNLKFTPEFVDLKRSILETMEQGQDVTP